MTKRISDELKKPILNRCPHCAAPNPLIAPVQIGDGEDSVMVAFVPQCCLKIIGCQLIAKEKTTVN